MNIPHAIKGALWGVLAVVVAALAFGAVSALSGAGGTSTASVPVAQATPKAAEHEADRKRRRGAITFGQYRRVRTGASKAQVRRRLGAPKTRDYSEAKVLDDTTRMEIWTYANRGKRFGAFIFTFTDGRLDGKSTV
jgi:hypothetical protein